jgi:hypothetical protein
LITCKDKISNDEILRFILENGYGSASEKYKLSVKELQDYVFFTNGRYNPAFFNKHNLKIQTKAGQLIPLVENPVQKKIQDCIDSQAGKPIRIKIPKARRHGGSSGIFWRYLL